MSIVSCSICRKPILQEDDVGLNQDEQICHNNCLQEEKLNG